MGDPCPGPTKAARGSLRRMGPGQGLAILSAVGVVVGVTAANNHAKESQVPPPCARCGARARARARACVHLALRQGARCRPLRVM